MLKLVSWTENIKSGNENKGTNTIQHNEEEARIVGGLRTDIAERPPFFPF